MDRISKLVASIDPDIQARLFSMLPKSGPPEIVETSSVRIAPDATSLTSTITGPLVRSGEPNLNGALFEPSDLEYGINSLVGGPLTVNHGNYAVGYLEESSLETSAEFSTYINISGRVWSKRFGSVWEQVEKAISEGKGALSMECVPSEIACMHQGCGCVIKPTEVANACSHIKTRSAPRRQVEPIFFGAALVLPPEIPGWPNARLSYR